MGFARELGRPHVPELERFFPDIGADGEIRTSFREMIARLRRTGILTAILSNTCYSLAKRHYRMGHYDLVDLHILSHEVGLHKPSPEIFAFALESAKVQASGALLVDDRAENVIAAREFGMHAIHYVDEQQLREQLSTYGMLAPD